MKIKSLLILVSAALLWTACSDNSSEKEVKKTKNEKEPEELGVDDGSGGPYDDYMAIIDASDTLLIGSSMYYTKNPDLSQENYQVYLLMSEDSDIKRIEERYTRPQGGSLLSNFHYYKDGARIATREIYNEGEGESEMFFERVTYYEEEKPKTSKLRSHRFEEYLENELFRLGGPKSIRGFLPNSIPTSKYAILKTQYNYLLNAKTKIYPLIDIARQYSIKWTNLLSTGIGYSQLRNNTLFNIEYAIGKNNRNNFNLNNSFLSIKVLTYF